MTEQVSTRSARNRRAVALMGWGCLVITAFFLSNARQTGSVRAVADEPVAFILAAFAAFVGVFSWMLYNPTGRSATASWSSFFAANATLFPPAIIGFCLMPISSPLRWWLAFGLFLLCVIAILSHVPDEFFGVPRERHTYLTPIPAFDRVEGTVLDPSASWFQLQDLSQVVLDTQRPSLAPRSYLQRGEGMSRSTGTAVRAEVRPISEVDDILGSDFDLGLLSDDLTFDDRPTPQSFRQRSETVGRRDQNRFQDDEFEEPQRKRSSIGKIFRRGPSRKGSQVYEVLNPESGRLRISQRERREAVRQRSLGRGGSRRVRHGTSLRSESSSGRSATGFLTGLAAGEVRRHSDRPAKNRSQRTSDRNSNQRNESRNRQTERIADDRSRQYSGGRQSSYHRNAAVEKREGQNRQGSEDSYLEDVFGESTDDRNTQRNTQNRQSRKKETRRQRKAEASDTTDRQHQRHQAERVQRSNQTRREQRTTREESVESNFSAMPVPVPFGPVTPPQDYSNEASATPQQLFGQTVQRELERSDRSERKQRTSSRKRTQQATQEAPEETQRQQRRSRYEDDARSKRQTASEETRVARDERTGRRSAAPAEPARSSGVKSRQQHEFERVADDDGSVLVEGVMPIHFDQGQKRANVHIPFSPPLPGMPEVECECVDGEDLRLKVPVRQSYGIRIEARRSNADVPLDAEVGFSAVYTND